MELKLLYHNARHKVKSHLARRPAAPPPATLTALPAEILHLILSHLCQHCARPADLELSDLDDGKLTLRSLCLVCRALRPPAQAFLAHSLCLRFGLRGYRTAKDDANFAVLRTLLECPALAASVRRLTLGGAEVFTTSRRRRPGRLPRVLREAELATTRTFRTGAVPLDCADDDKMAVTRLVRDLFVSLTHNLTELSFPLGFRRGARRAADMAAAACFAAQNSGVSGGLPALQTLTLFPERGSDFVLDDPRIRIFLAAAPNLRRLAMDQMWDRIANTADAVGLGEGASHQPDTGPVLRALPVMPHLQSIHLQNCMIEDDAAGRNLAELQTLLALAPNLCRFQFSAGCDINFHKLEGGRVLSLLDPFCDTLVDLGLSFHAATHCRHHDAGSLQQLLRFSKLRVLRLDEAAYCHNRHPGQADMDSRNAGAGAVPVPPECLTRILPPSVQVLHLELMDRCMRQHDALRLASHVADGRFPNLSHVQIETAMHAPPHGAVRLRSMQQAVDRGWIGASQHESDVVRGFLEANNVGVWMRNAGSFDDWDAEAFLKLD